MQSEILKNAMNSYSALDRYRVHLKIIIWKIADRLQNPVICVFRKWSPSKTHLWYDFAGGCCVCDAPKCSSTTSDSRAAFRVFSPINESIQSSFTTLISEVACATNVAGWMFVEAEVLSKLLHPAPPRHTSPWNTWSAPSEAPDSRWMSRTEEPDCTFSSSKRTGWKLRARCATTGFVI